MTTGDGGMIVTNSMPLFKHIKAMRWVGIDKDNWKTSKNYTNTNKDAMHWFYELSVLGYKYNMNDLAASIGLVQFKKLDSMNSRRAEIILDYLDALKSCFKIKPILPYNPKKYVYQMFCINCSHKEKLILFLKSKGIATGCHYTPLNTQPLFKNYYVKCNVAETAYENMITLPLHVDLKDSEVKYITDALKEFDSYE